MYLVNSEKVYTHNAPPLSYDGFFNFALFANK